MGWNRSMCSLGLWPSFSSSESSAGVPSLEKRFLLGCALRDASVLSLPSYCSVHWSPYPQGHRLETSQVLRGKRETVFSVSLSRLNCGAHSLLRSSSGVWTPPHQEACLAIWTPKSVWLVPLSSSLSLSPSVKWRHERWLATQECLLNYCAWQFLMILIKVTFPFAISEKISGSEYHPTMF